MDVIDAIRQQMERKDITLRDAAERVGCSAQNVWTILNRSSPKTPKGKRKISFKLISDLCNAVGLELRVTRSNTEKGSGDILEIAKDDAIPFNSVVKLLSACGWKLTVRENK